MLLERSLILMGGQRFLKDSEEQVALLGGARKKLLHVLIMSHQGAVSGCAWVSFVSLLGGRGWEAGRRYFGLTGVSCGVGR